MGGREFTADYCVGYGIDSKFNLLKTNDVRLAFRVSDDPFSKTGFELSTAYHSLKKHKYNQDLWWSKKRVRYYRTAAYKI